MSRIVPVNGTDRDWTRHRYILWFGAYGEIRLMVWANSLEDAFDEAVDWLAENAPGLLADEAVNDAYNRAIEDGASHEAAAKAAEMDMMIGGNCGHYVNSWEWGIVAEDPTRDEILAMQA